MVVVVEELKHDVEEQEVYTMEVLISMRNLGGSSKTRVVSTVIWCISWRNSAEGCTNPWRVSIITHGPIYTEAPLHSLLALLFFLWRLHLI